MPSSTHFRLTFNVVKCLLSTFCACLGLSSGDATRQFHFFNELDHDREYPVSLLDRVLLSIQRSRSPGSEGINTREITLAEKVKLQEDARSSQVITLQRLTSSSTSELSKSSAAHWPARVEGTVHHDLELVRGKVGSLTLARTKAFMHREQAFTLFSSVTSKAFRS